MFSTLAKNLIFFLVLLQLIAPLVHAHASTEEAGRGIHLPRLEHYSVGTDSVIIHALKYLRADEGSIISIGAGIKHKKVSADNSEVFCLPAEYVFFNTDSLPDYPLDYHQQTRISVVRYVLLPSRAPPPQTSLTT